MQPTPGADPRAPIAVIGAGIAGLACARQLQAAGRAVEVFECAAQPGGRVATWRADDGTQCDHGAQYFTAHTPDFLAVLADLEKAGCIARWHPRLAAIDTTGPRAVHDATVRYVGCPDMAALPRHLAESLKLHLNLRVEACHHDGAHWTLTAAGVPQPKRYSSLLLALPAPQAAALIAASAPTFAAHARDCPMHACWALIARHEDDPGVGFDAAFVNAGPLSWIARDSSKPQRPAATRGCSMRLSPPRSTPSRRKSSPARCSRPLANTPTPHRPLRGRSIAGLTPTTPAT